MCYNEPRKKTKGVRAKLVKIALAWLVFALVLLPGTAVLLTTKPAEAG